MGAEPGPGRPKKVVEFKPRPRPRWFAFAKAAEISRILFLEARIERRKALIADDHAERLRIQDRCVKRMERAGRLN
ncbi:hypothetical protein Ga0080574_TMP2782 [Salipiger abyssi]|uniref:Uncharacterized protein n=1 Tax=Salipiger abyssi TaxID=1250539 RepID=A0A1P8UUT9_9RHOB|nr:hypothetical protein Ga0080574_TMP2782 [Salipiger abyssi]